MVVNNRAPLQKKTLKLNNFLIIKFLQIKFNTNFKK